jgi:hypothetical protein
MTKISKSAREAIREHLGHGEGNRRVVIKRNGDIHYYGSLDATDRSHDYWHFGGHAAALARRLEVAP